MPGVARLSASGPSPGGAQRKNEIILLCEEVTPRVFTFCDGEISREPVCNQKARRLQRVAKGCTTMFKSLLTLDCKGCGYIWGCNITTFQIEDKSVVTFQGIKTRTKNSKHWFLGKTHLLFESILYMWCVTWTTTNIFYLKMWQSLQTSNQQSSRCNEFLQIQHCCICVHKMTLGPRLEHEDMWPPQCIELSDPCHWQSTRSNTDPQRTNFSISPSWRHCSQWGPATDDEFWAWHSFPQLWLFGQAHPSLHWLLCNCCNCLQPFANNVPWPNLGRDILLPSVFPIPFVQDSTGSFKWAAPNLIKV